MRRLAAVITIVIGSAVLSTPATAAPARLDRLNRQVTGPFIETAQTSLGACPGAPNDGHHDHLLSDGTYAPAHARRPGKYHLDECLTGSGGFFDISGTFTITTPHGARISGHFRGTDLGGRIEDTLVVTSGTRQFRRVTGTIKLSGVGFPALGTLTGNLTRTCHRSEDSR